jgi:8-oxo-dGTP pyrophosphatase MutT (NUDIX family)
MSGLDHFISTFENWRADKVVSVCFIEAEGKWLFVRPKVRRGIDKSLMKADDLAFWEPVGGKINPGESPIQAMRREIKEELNTSLESLEQVGVELANFSDKFRLTMNIFRGSGLVWPPSESKEVEIKWFDAPVRGQMWDSDFDYFDLLKAGQSFRQYSYYNLDTNRLEQSATLPAPVLEIMH